MKKLTRSEVTALLQQQNNIVILTHCGPDGDTLGSAALLCRTLRAMGKWAWILENPEMREVYDYLVEGLTTREAVEGQFLICVDVAERHMLPEVHLPLAEKIALRIDHHSSSVSFTEMELVDSGAAACCEIIYDLTKLLGVELDEEMAIALYTAISTDTGCFRYANTTANTFLAAAACAEKTNALPELNRVHFETNSLGKLRLQGYLAENAIFVKEGRAVICALTLETVKSMGLTDEDTFGLAAFPRTIAGVEFSVLLRQQENDHIGVSVRALPGHDAGAFCEKFGGGGHKGAGGGGFTGTMEAAIQAVIAALPDTL